MDDEPPGTVLFDFLLGPSPELADYMHGLSILGKHS
jgi:hypothetical protein